MKRLSDNAIEIVNELHTERLAYESEYVPIIDALNRLAEYEDAEEQGLLVWLPCKVGNMVYRVIHSKNGSGHVAPAIVGGLHLADTTRNRRYQKEYEYIVLKGVFGGFIAHVNKKEFGKTVFLTREEAKKALEGHNE